MSDRKETVSISDKMAKLIYGDRQLFWGLGFLILGLSALMGSFFLYRFMEDSFDYSLKNPGYFDSYTAAGYSSIEVQYMTDSFAEHIQEKYLLYFGFDANSKPFILCGESELPRDLKAIRDYTYGDEVYPIPDPVRVSGYCRPLDSEIMGFARDSYSTMWDEDSQIPISSDELSAMVGNYFLDIRPSSFQKEYPWARGIFFFPAVFLVAGLSGLWRYRRRLKACHRRMEGYSSWISQADGELSQAEAFDKRLPLYLTRNYLITAMYYFEIIPLAQITQLSESLNILTAVTEDGSRHMLMERHKGKKAYDRLKAELENRIKNEQIYRQMGGSSLWEG